MPRETVLVVGGAGYIGSHVNKMLKAAGFSTVVLDNLSTGNKNAVVGSELIIGDMADTALLDTLFTTRKIGAVMHFAAFIDVGESVHNPMKYYVNNVINTVNLLDTMRRHNVNRFIFSSSAAIFGMPQEEIITETHPARPINPYGNTKLMVEKILEDFRDAYGISYCSLRYFNAAGGDPEGKLKNYKKTESNLIPVVLRSLKFGSGAITINGSDYPTPDGTCIRDFIHIMDLGQAHITAMEQLLAGAPSAAYNLGNGRGFSVKQVIDAAARVTGKTPKITYGPRRPGDPPKLVADCQKARQQLGWTPLYADLDTMISHAWKAL